MEGKKRVSNTPDRLREAMKEARKSITELATETGLSHSTVSRYLSGKIEPRQEAIIKLAKALGVSEWWLWGYDVAAVRTPEQKKNDELARVIVQMRSDPDFFNVVMQLAGLPPEQYAAVKALLSTLRSK